MSDPIRDEWRSEDGAVRLILGDCLDVLPTLSGIDAVVTDPPYGVDIGSQNMGKWRASKMKGGTWDLEQPDLAPVLALNVPTCIWGGNYFPLPPSRAVLVWHKGAGFAGRDFAECEIAWCSWDMNARCKTYDPLAAGDYRDKVHPTQKPVAIMVWCLHWVPCGTVADPYMGSGTTGVACVRTGRRFVGIEIEPKYWEIAVRRVRAELERFPLFEPAARPRQLELLDAGAVSVDCPG